MKIVMKDAEGQPFEVGYDQFDSIDNDCDTDLLFWIDSPVEQVTLKLNKKELGNLIAAMQFLREKV